MKILLLTYNFGGTASGKISARIANELSRLGHEIVVICSEKYEKQSVDGRIKLIECPSILNPKSLLNKLRIKVIQKLGRNAYNSNFFWREVAYLRACILLKNWYPDWIYCRTTPLDSSIVGARLHLRYNIPVYQHFTDPLPTPFNDLSEKNLEWYHFLKNAIYILKEANLVSFGTQQMLNYEQSLLPFCIKNKSFVSPDVTSNISKLILLEKKKSEKIVLTYLGSLYGKRNPQPLFDSLNSLNSVTEKFVLNIYSQAPDSQIGIAPWINYLGYTDDIQTVFENSTILVDLDGDDKIPVFISSKLKDYLMVNRPILSITPSNSPSSNLLEGLKTVAIVRNDVGSIISGIKSLSNSFFKDECFEERCKLINEFSPKTVVNNIVDKMLEYEK